MPINVEKVDKVRVKEMNWGIHGLGRCVESAWERRIPVRVGQSLIQQRWSEQTLQVAKTTESAHLCF